MTDHNRAALVRAIFRRVSEQPLDDIGLETRITDLGIDSITFAEIVVQIEDTLGIEISFDRWLRVRTVQEVLDMIEHGTRSNEEKGA
ncbi:MAG TPA: acyl carrier protein [Pseudonocardiaceae bacterium]|nr:acyl carrier protein [Pseudonocardiaceae bacterium]